MARAKNGAKAFFGRPKYVSAKRKLATQARWGGVGKPSLRSCKEKFSEKILHQQQQNQCRDMLRFPACDSVGLHAVFIIRK